MVRREYSNRVLQHDQLALADRKSLYFLHRSGKLPIRAGDLWDILVERPKTRFAVAGFVADNGVFAITLLNTLERGCGF